MLQAQSVRRHFRPVPQDLLVDSESIRHGFVSDGVSRDVQSTVEARSNDLTQLCRDRSAYTVGRRVVGIRM